MKKLIYLILFLPVIGFGQTYPYQIEPDTTHRMIMMTDTSVIDSPALEFVYYSIDSLVRQITKDSLGLDSTYWSLDDSLSLSPINQTNNIVLGNLSGNTSMTGVGNFIVGNSLGNSITTGSYNALIGSNIFTGLNTENYNFVFGLDNNISSSNASFVSGASNFNGAALDRSFLNGQNNLSTSSGNFYYSFVNGQDNVNGGATDVRYVFSNGYRNGFSISGSPFYSFMNGGQNVYSALDLDYAFLNGLQNAYNTTNFNYGFANGYRNGYGVTGNMSYSFLAGRENVNAAASSLTYSFVVGYRNIFQSTSALSNIIAIGQENGYSATADHSNSIYLGYRNAYNGSGNYNNYQGYEAGYNQTGSYNVGLGYRALYGQSGLSTGSYNIALGYSAGDGITNQSYGIYIGYRAGLGLSANGIAIGRDAMLSGSGDNNVAIGDFALSSMTTGYYNFALGQQSLRYVTSGWYNTGIGTFALRNTTTGYRNVALGSLSLQNAQNDNVGIGALSGSVSTGSSNIYIGMQSGYTGSGSFNTFIGAGSGRNHNGNSNVFIGYNSGYNETGSNKLYIENSNSATPLIYGDFANDTVRINGNLEVTNKTGTAGNLAGFDGDQIVDSGIDASSVLTSEVDGSVTNELQTLSFSNPNLSISSGNTVSLSSINYWDYNGTTSEIYTTTNVGINTTNPSYDLDVIGNMRLSGIFYDGASSSGSSGNIIENSFGEMRWVSKSSIGLSEFNNDLGLTSTPWTIAASDEIYFNTAGNDIVGINTISPTRNLQVNGTGYFSQDLEIVQDLKAVSATTSFEDTDGDRGTSGDLLGRDANGLDWVSPSNISENDLDNDMPTGKASKGTNTTISVSGTVLTLTSLDINSPSGWSIGTSTNLEVPETGLYLVVVNFAKENSNCTSMTAVLRSDATTLYTWYPADYSNQIGFSASTIESLTSTSSLNVRVTSSTSGCNVFNYEISATKLSD